MKKRPQASPIDAVSRLTPGSLGCVSVLSLLLFCPGLAAQTVPNSSPTAAVGATGPTSDQPANVSGETVTLPQFTVQTSATNDYVAAETITGTRIATNLMDLPFNVNVATSEFIKDFGAQLELNDQVGYMSSVIPAEGRALPGSLQSSVTIRGFPADVDLVDGFRRPAGALDSADTDRIEVIKGPEAGIYGRIEPGGVVNLVTKKPEAEPAASLLVSVGDYAQRHAEVSSTGPILDGGNVFYRVDLAVNSREYEMKYREAQVQNGSVQLLWKITPSSSINFALDDTYRHELPGSNTPMIVATGVADPYQINPNGTPAPTVQVYEKPALNLMNFNNVGPGAWTDLTTKTFTTEYENRLSSDWTLRWGLNFFEQLEERQFLSNTATVLAANGGAPDFTTVYTGTSFTPGNTARYPDYDRQREYGYNSQTDLVGTVTTGPIKQRLLITLDANRDARRKQEWQMYTATANNPLDNAFAAPLSVANPDYFFLNFLQAPQLYGERAQQNYINTDDTYGCFVSDRVGFFHDRLMALVGARYDYVYSVRDLNYVPPGPLNGSLAAGNARLNTDFSNRSFTYQAGVNFALTHDTMLYANHSTSYEPVSLINNEGVALPNETGEGTEGGVKISWLSNTLNLTMCYYDIAHRNIADTVLVDPVADVSDTFAIGEQVSKGAEADFNWQIIPGAQIFGGYGRNNTKITVDNSQPFLINTNPRRDPNDNLGVGGRYEIESGWAKGLYVTAGVRHYGSSVALSTGSRTLNPSTEVIINAREPNGVLPFPQYPVGSYIYNSVITVNGHQTIAVNSGVRISVDNGQSAIRNPAYTDTDASVGYRWAGRMGSKRLEHKLQLNLQNVTDEEYLIASLRPGEPRGFTATYTLSY